VMGMNDDLKVLFHFLNKGFIGRNYPTRPLKRRGRHKSSIRMCFDCRGFFDSSLMRVEAISRSNIRLCSSCFEKRLSRERKEYLNNRKISNLEKIGEFKELLSGCRTLGTCDILAAHHEFLKDDPERLKTTFLVGIVCGQEKLLQYMRPG
jgi:hypothetical protein